MKKFLCLLLCSSLISLVSFSSRAATQTGVSNAKVVAPIVISATTPLEFGSFASSAAAGTITQAGIVSGGVTAISSGATRTAGVFTITGESSVNTDYTFNLPATATLVSGINTMVATLTYGSGASGRTLNSGSDTVIVNGSLAVAANQASGAYTGTYDVTAVY